eukprot:XP_001696397.1 predicted protein [Chlamydomonas reinhardtii]
MARTMPRPNCPHLPLQPAGVLAGWSSPAGAASPSPDYKVAAQAVERAVRAQWTEEQVDAGVRPNAALTAAAAGGLADGASPMRQSGQWADLPERGVSASPEVLGRRQGLSQQWHGAAHSLPAHHARRSLQGALSDSSAPSGATVGSSAPPSAQARRNPAPADARAALLRASSPAAPLAAGGARTRNAAGNAAGGAASWSQIDDLRRQVEESVAETARLRHIADLAAQPIPARSPLPSTGLDTRPNAQLRASWQLQAEVAPLAPSSRPHPATDAGPPYAQLAPPPWAMVAPQAQAWGVSWSRLCPAAG